MVKVSVIIPVFHPGEGLAKCIQALRDQTLQEIELIFVDDRGSDKDAELIRKASGDDSRIIFIQNEENLGPGPSRNRGIEAASGEYLAFADPDDYPAEDFLALLYAKALESGADIVKGVCALIDVDGKRIPQKRKHTLNDWIKCDMAMGKPLYSVFSYEHQAAIYRHELLIRSGARYGTSRNSEDTTFLLRVCLAAESIAFEERAVYCYSEREGSLDRVFTAQRLKEGRLAYREMAESLLPQRAKDLWMYDYMAQQVLHWLKLLVKTEQGESKEAICETRNAFREELLSSPLAFSLAERNASVYAFLQDNVDLVPDPYGSQWGNVPYSEYEGIAQQWVKYLSEHPESVQRAEWDIRHVFENAIMYQGRESTAEKRRRLKELRELARQLPDRTVLTKEYLLMRLFIDYGVDLFGVCQSKLRGTFQKLLRFYRNQVKLRSRCWKALRKDYFNLDGAIEKKRTDSKETVKVSVIIPVFHPGEGLAKCIQALRDQTLQEIELIFVDDRGSDKDAELIRKASGDDSRIIFIQNEENLGPGPSRNRGIEAASGEYLAFADPDDYPAEDFLALLYAKALESGADIVKGVCALIDVDGKRIPQKRKHTLNDWIKCDMAMGKPLYSVFSYEHQAAIYRHELLIRSGARYGTSRNSEDTTFLLRVCLAAESIAFEERAVYCYSEREGSLDRVFTAQRLKEGRLAYREMAESLLPQRAKDLWMYDYMAQQVLHWLKLLVKTEQGESKEAICETRNAFREELLSSPLAFSLAERNASVYAFLQDNVDLVPDPYGSQWGNVPYSEYEGIAQQWVKYLSEHPESVQRAEWDIRHVFENAIMYQGRESTAEKRRRLKELRELARQLPDRTVLTKEYLLMRLFIDYGIILFDR